ncbi:N-acyl amino acid synthase FeeM domain-containing protein [Neorhodopirellula pilleata]|uniref:N-acyl amino acid synthase FeeM catalytic core domain-containing protein n=1 Tax=Neorhodopirellula pilleata TaxID=2714738 RepID=A0A5C6AHA7_9BACT|nr:hypothetical protein [Neorhodopirellula pilleata]TWT98827.1 hypothetical protein Pla100_19930 [Neorhodopirellula pilleata]
MFTEEIVVSDSIPYRSFGASTLEVPRSKSGGRVVRNRDHQTIYSNLADGVSIERFYGSDDSSFEHIQQIRSQRGGHQLYFDFDAYSFHYCLSVDRERIGTLTATMADEGQLDCQDYYPPKLIQEYADIIFSPCKFAIQRSRYSSMRLMRLMVRETWRDLLSQGCRLSLMNARREMVPFYRRMGFHIIAGSDFVHPTCGTDSQVMYMTADPQQRSYFADLFEFIDDAPTIEV